MFRYSIFGKGSTFTEVSGAGIEFVPNHTGVSGTGIDFVPNHTGVSGTGIDFVPNHTGVSGTGIDFVPNLTVVSGAGIEAVPDLAEDLGRVVPEKIRPVYFGTCPNALYPMIPCYLPPLRVDCTRRAQSSTQLEFRVVCPP